MAVSEYIYAGDSGGSKVVKKYRVSDLSLIATSPSFAVGDIQAIESDNNYVYVAGGGAGHGYIRIYNLYDLSYTGIQSPDYGGLILSLKINGGYIYAAGETVNTIVKYNISDLTLVATSPDVGNHINDIAISGNYIYAGTYYQGTIRKYNLSDLTYTGIESPFYNNNIETLAISGNYIYAGGWTTRTVRKYNLSDLTYTGIESGYFGANIQSILAYGNYIYAAGNNKQIHKLNASNLMPTGIVGYYSNTILKIVTDGTYIYSGGFLSPYKIQKYNISDLSVVAISPTHSGSICALSIAYEELPNPPSFCETTPYNTSASTCGNADGKITIITPSGYTSYFDVYDFTLTDVDGNSYTFNDITGEATGLTSNYYFLTATVKPAYWYYYGREECTFEWIKIEDSDNTSYLNRVVVTPLQCQPFDVQYGRIYYEVSGLTSGNTFSFDAYTSDLSVYYSATGITSTQGFILRNAEAQCYWVRIKDEVGGCTLLLDNRCVNSIPLFSLSGIKKLWIAAWNDDLDYNYWSTADDDYFLEFEDTSFFTSTKIKEFLSLTGGTTGVTWYSLPVAGKVATLGQKLNKVPQGYIFEDTLSFAISKADADKWTKMATIINPENKWITIVEDANGFMWTSGYRHGARITAYKFDIGSRDGDNGYALTISAQSENKLLTLIDTAYVDNYVR